MSVFIECIECGFVLYALDAETPHPKHWDSCPACDGMSFEFTDDEDSR
jgi:hypothetical protein